MARFKVILTKQEVYYVEANNHDEAVDEAIRLDTDGGDPWARKQYYDKMESEELNDGTV